MQGKKDCEKQALTYLIVVFKFKLKLFDLSFTDDGL
jgi:hypothetical protein